MFNFDKKENNLPKTTEDEEKKLQEIIKQAAYSESEIELGTDLSNEQAAVSRLNSNDSDYISKVEALVKEKLNNPEWVKISRDKINRKKSDIPSQDELYKSGRGILGSHLKENNDNNKDPV